MRRPYLLLSCLPIVFLVLINFLVPISWGIANDNRDSIDMVAPDLFEAVQAGQVDAKFIALGADRANILINNKTDHVVHVKLPDAFAAVPVLGQFGQDPQAGGQNGGGSTQAVGGGPNRGNAMQGQGIGIGFGNGFGNGIGNGGGNNLGRPGGGQNRFMNGFMRIAPGKTRKVAATTVCLQHGKPDPNPRVVYRMVPITSFCDDPRIANLCRRLGRGKLDQRVAQAVAWNVANGKSWSELADLNRIESRYRGSIKYFTKAQLKQARRLATTLQSKHITDADRAAVSYLSPGS